nr:hypothetical protein [uncultured Cellulosilyticum sp.]
MRVEQFKYYLLDHNDNPKLPGNSSTNLLHNVIEGDISYNSLGRLKSSLTVKIQEDELLNIDYMNDRVKPVAIIDGVEYPLGIFLISSPNRNIESTGVTRTLTCYSKLKILDNDKVLARYYVPSGSNVVNQVINLLGNEPYDIAISEATTNTDHEWEVGTSKLDIINDLLDIINYVSLIPGADGKFISYPYKLPSEREHTIEYVEGNDSIIVSSMVEDFDFFDVPNIFVRYTNSVDIDPPIVATYPLQTGDNPITIDGRAPNVSVEEVSDISDQSTLYAKCKQDAYNARSVYSHLEFSTAINPVHSYLDCIWVKVGDIDYKYIETSWSFNLRAGNLMKHVARRVVNLDAN